MPRICRFRTCTLETGVRLKVQERTKSVRTRRRSASRILIKNHLCYTAESDIGLIDLYQFVKSVFMTKEELTRIIPEFNEIQDRTLREKTLQVWIDAMNENNWDIASLQRMPFTLLVEKVSTGFVSHVRTVCRMCLAMLDVLKDAYGDRLEVSRDNLIAGALLADVGKLHEYSKEGDRFVFSKSSKYLRHPFVGVALASKQDIPEDILHIIAVHSKEAAGFKRSPEAIIFHHADFTEFELVQ